VNVRALRVRSRAVPGPLFWIWRSDSNADRSSVGRLEWVSRLPDRGSVGRGCVLSDWRAGHRVRSPGSLTRRLRHDSGGGVSLVYRRAGARVRRAVERLSQRVVSGGGYQGWDRRIGSGTPPPPSVSPLYYSVTPSG